MPAPDNVAILHRERLVKTSVIDQADWNYRWILGRILRLRYSQIVRWLPSKCMRLLEIGYGSGVFMPTLRPRAVGLYGLDLHGQAAQVKNALAAEGIYAELVQASADAIPFATGTFDCIVVASTLEFVCDLDVACCEIRRILIPGGTFIAVTPIESPLLDFGLKVLTGKSAKRDFGARRRKVVPTLRRNFTVTEHRILKAGLLPAYDALLMTQ